MKNEEEERHKNERIIPNTNVIKNANALVENQICILTNVIGTLFNLVQLIRNDT